MHDTLPFWQNSCVLGGLILILLHPTIGMTGIWDKVFLPFELHSLFHLVYRVRALSGQCSVTGRIGPL